VQNKQNLFNENLILPRFAEKTGAYLSSEIRIVPYFLMSVSFTVQADIRLRAVGLDN